MPKTFLFVFSDPAEGAELPYNEWYDSDHVKELLEIPGFVAARRYRSSAATLPRGFGGIEQKYLAAFELDEPQRAIDELAARTSDGTIAIPGVIARKKRFAMFEPITEWTRR